MTKGRKDRWTKGLDDKRTKGQKIKIEWMNATKEKSMKESRNDK